MENFALTFAYFLSTDLLWRPTEGSINFLYNIDKETTKFLTSSLREVPYLNLKLRSTHFYGDTENEYVRWFFTQSECSLKVSTYDNTLQKPILENRDSFAIATSMENLQQTTTLFTNKAGVFFYIVVNTINMDQTKEIFHKMWIEQGIHRSYLLTTLGVFIYNPFALNTTTRFYGSIKPFNFENKIEKIIFNNMQKYPLRIQIFKSVYSRPIMDNITQRVLHVEGVDGGVAHLLQERMNFTMNLMDPDPNYFGERHKNGTYNGAIGSIIREEIDISLTGFFIKDYLVPEMAFTVAVYDDKLCCYVPKAPRIPQSILPLFSVHYDVWLGYFLTAFTSASFWALIRRINVWMDANDISRLKLQRSYKFQFIQIFIDTWLVWVRVNIKYFPPFYSERMLIISLCLVSVIFGAIFESSLATVYIHPLYYNDINTLKELDESGLKIIYKFTSMKDDLFFSETSPLFANLNRKLEHIENLNADIISDIAEKGGFSSVSRYSSLMLESVRYINLKKIHLVPDCPKYYSIAYVMPKDSPFERRINSLLLRFLNSGLIKKMINDMQTKANIAIMKLQANKHSEIFKILTLNDLQLSFYVVLFGNSMAALAFIIECCIRRKRIRINPITYDKIKSVLT